MTQLLTVAQLLCILCDVSGAPCTSVCVCVCDVQVSGVITDCDGVVRYVVSGSWDSKIEGASVLNGTDEASAVTGKPEYITGETKLLWQRRYPP